MSMAFRISPLWWPLLALASPAVAPWLLVRNRRFLQNCDRAAERNRARLERAVPLDLPALDHLDLTVLVEWRASEGFLGDAGVSYLIETDGGTLLYDIGFGATRPALAHNARRLDIDLDRVQALAISHLHLDHMGGLDAQRTRQVTVAPQFLPSDPRPCFLPAQAAAPGFEAEVVEGPRPLAAGMASTGPLARSLFFGGLLEEQALVARLEGKGLVVLTGCGHPGIDVILHMLRRLSDEPLYAVGGGLHFPVTGGRGNRAGIQFQTLVGTGKPPWQQITDQDLSRTIAVLNAAGPQKVYLSAHDTCDHALHRLQAELRAETQVLAAGATYRL
jgi:7,8-dihydropterin-6-yl-methyl-4-(beta-D-ribofuranosyl)aminobenzene 5'-phosphate synthase